MEKLILFKLHLFCSMPVAVRQAAEEWTRLSLDQFDLISQWQHYAILEMMNLSDFRPSLPWIAQKLGTKITETKDYVDRLQRVGLLKVTAKGDWIDLSKGHSTHILGENVTSQAHKQSQKAILTKAIQSLDEVAIGKRDQSSMMMATDPRRIQMAKQVITKFRRQLTKFLEDADQKTAVYQLSISLFPMVDTKTENA